MEICLPALPFALFAGVANLFLEKQTAFAFGKLSVPFGLLSFLVILLKTFLTVSSVVLLFATTAQKSLIAALSAIKVPGLLLVQLSMSLRYLSILTDETQRMSAAYLLRSVLTKGFTLPMPADSLTFAAAQLPTCGTHLCCNDVPGLQIRFDFPRSSIACVL